MKNKKLIPWWELNSNIHFELREKFLQFLKRTRIEMGISKVRLAKDIEVNEVTVHNWEKGIRGIRVCYLIKILEKLNLSKLIVYGNIKSIYTLANRCKILRPNLPLKEKEEHIQIICHGIFDGTEDHAERRTNGGIVYQSSNELEQGMFKKLIEECKFGQFNIIKSSKGEYRFPSILAQLLLRHYKFVSINSRKARFPTELISKISQNKQLGKLILKACFTDEGSCGYKKVRDNLCVFSSVNVILIEQVSEILKFMNYSFFVNKAPNRDCQSIYLHSKSLPKFYKDIIVLLPKDYYKRKNARILLNKQKREHNINLQIEFLEKLIKIQRYVKNAQIRELFNLHDASARRRAKRLVRKGIVIKKSRGFYEAIQNSDPYKYNS